MRQIKPHRVDKERGKGLRGRQTGRDTGRDSETEKERKKGRCRVWR